MAEEDRVDISEEVNPPAPTLSQPPPTHAPPPPTPAGILPAYSGAPPAHLPPLTSSGALHAHTSQTPSSFEDQARIAALEGTVNQMATNMAELLALLRGPNRASSSSTPPPGQGPTADSTPWAPPIQAPENIEAPAPPTLHTSTVYPFTTQLLPPPAPTAVPFPPVTFLSSEHILSAPPPVSILALAMAHTVPPPMDGRPHQQRGGVIKESPRGAVVFRREESEGSFGKRRQYGTSGASTIFSESHDHTDHRSYLLSSASTTPTQSIYYSAPPIPPPTGSQPYNHLAPASAQPSQPRPPVSRAPPPAQQDPTPQGQQVGGAPNRLRKQYTPLPALLSHIYRQLLADNQIQPVSPGPNFDPSVQNQSKHCEYHQGAPGHTLDNCWRLRDEIQRRIDSNRLTFNVVRPPNVQANPLLDHRPSSGPSINMISICVSERDEEAQENPPRPFVINYTPKNSQSGSRDMWSHRSRSSSTSPLGSCTQKARSPGPTKEVWGASSSNSVSWG
ncbi:extensin-like [Punica granatum]|uniref:Extensin-like n=1 Tax=Punica granatum TaxID=22663 RepID=A0A6P8D754_PUNGR|nr:extensin-like [Punica granatum]